MGDKLVEDRLERIRFRFISGRLGVVDQDGGTKIPLDDARPRSPGSFLRVDPALERRNLGFEGPEFARAFFEFLPGPREFFRELPMLVAAAFEFANQLIAGVFLWSHGFVVPIPRPPKQASRPDEEDLALMVVPGRGETSGGAKAAAGFAG